MVIFKDVTVAPLLLNPFIHRPKLDDVFAHEYPSHRNLTEHRESVSSSSGSSICEPCSPMGRRLSTDVNAEASEEQWNLVAYHVPWGPGYEGYERGTLPGPEGNCIFLRSPTPLKRQRTTQACESCRERKAKCSGTRPSCARCLARGLDCMYSASTSVDATQHRTPQRRSSHTSLRPPPHTKVPMRTRLRRKSSLAESVITMPVDTGGSVQETNSTDFKQRSYTAPWDGLSMELNGDVSGYSLGALGDDFESPTEPPTSSPSFTSPSHDSAVYPFSGILRRSLSFPEDTSLYTHSLSELDGYRFPPPEAESKPFTMPQIPLASSSFDPNPPLMEQPGLLKDEPGMDIIWHGSGFDQPGSRTMPGAASSESSTNTAPDPSKEFYSQPVFVQPGLDEALTAQYQA